MWYILSSGDVEDEGGVGYREHYGTHQFTIVGSYVTWDGPYIGFYIYCVSGSGDYDLLVFVTDS